MAENSGITWTPNELALFDELAAGTESRDQVTRISARMRLSKFISEHGKAKCDAMWAHIVAASHKSKRGGR